VLDDALRAIVVGDLEAGDERLVNGVEQAALEGMARKSSARRGREGKPSTS